MIADASGSALLPHQRTIESLWAGEDAGDLWHRET